MVSTGNPIDAVQALAHLLGRIVREGDHGDVLRSSHTLTHNVVDLRLNDVRLARPGTGTYEHAVIEIDNRVALRLI